MKKPYCHLISHGISIKTDSIRVCCLTKDAGISGQPVIFDSYDINNFSWKEIIEAKKKQIELLKNGEMKECHGCYAIEEQEYSEEDNYISYINFDHWTECNSNCIYCGSFKGKSKNQNNLYPIIKELLESSYFRKHGEITFQGGEPTLLEEIDDLLELFAKNEVLVRIHSSGIKFNENLHKSIQKGLASVVISIDSSNKETYKKIKRVDRFDFVYNNLKKYAENQNENTIKRVKAKYIIIPGYNDSISEINNFLNKMKKIGITSIIIDIECRAHVGFGGKIPKNMQVLVDYFKFKTKKYKMELDYYDSARYFESQRTDSKKLHSSSIAYYLEHFLSKKDFEKYRINYQ